MKQLISLFLSVNDINVRDAHPDLVRYVMNKYAVGIPRGFKIYVYYTLSHILRFSPFIGYANIGEHTAHVFSEITYPPYGYVLTSNTAPPGKNLCDITHFARYRYGELADLEMPPVVKEVNTFIPGDYRSTEQVNNSGEIPGSNLVYTPEDTIEAIHELQRSFNGVRARLSP